MTIHNYLLFVSACIALALVTGPDMAYMLARCIAQGRRAGVFDKMTFVIKVRDAEQLIDLWNGKLKQQREVINYGLSRLKRSGAYDELYVRWFPVSFY